MEQTKDEEDRSRPALMVLFGSRGRNVWPLERAVMTLGRAHGCDVCLDAPDVSSLHCMIWRSALALQLRDCGSRSGTLLNGAPVTESSLHDGDVLQVGSFSFRVYVPAAMTRACGPEWRLRHVERSRRHLGRLALALRKRLREQQQLLSPEVASAFDLNRKASGLRNYFQVFQQRIRQLEEAERALARDRALFDEEKQAYHELVRQAEEDLVRREQDDKKPGRSGFGFFWRHRQLEKTP